MEPSNAVRMDGIAFRGDRYQIASPYVSPPADCAVVSIKTAGIQHYQFASLSTTYTHPMILSIFLLWLGLGARARSTKGGASVRLDQATVTGTVNGSVESFLGIPYAHPP